jgi:type IV pilus assembly protein PilX
MKRTSVHRSMLGMGRRDSQRGIVLPMTLILLLIMITMGSMTARNAATSVQISNNYRTNSVAFQAAEIGLRYCEAVAANVYEESGSGFPGDKSKVPTTASSTNWNSLSNWTSTNNVISVPASVYKAAQDGVQSDIQLKHAPTCIIDRVASSNSSRFLITARGRSNDSTIDSTSSRLTSGSEVWLQSTLMPQ